MVHAMKVPTLKVKSMGRGNFNLQMEVCILETFNIMKFQEGESMYGLMAKPMMGSGKKTKCMDMVFSPGKMESDMKDIL